MVYYENIVNDDQADDLEKYLISHPWSWGFYSKEHMEGSVPHWSIIFSGISKPNEEIYSCEHELVDPIQNIWNLIKSKYFQNDTLIRCYANGITKGIDQRVHTDDLYPGSKTFILYVNKQWNVDWAGETIVWDKTNRQIIGSFFPKFNCGLLINGSQWHGVRPVSTYCNKLRITLMFKTRPSSFFGENNASL